MLYIYIYIYSSTSKKSGPTVCSFKEERHLFRASRDTIKDSKRKQTKAIRRRSIDVKRERDYGKALNQEKNRGKDFRMSLSAQVEWHGTAY